MKYLDAAWFHEAVPTDGSDDDVMPLLGYFFCWAACSSLVSEFYTELDLEALKTRELPPLSVISHIDSKLGSDDFNEKGNAFAANYLEKRYFDDFCKAFLEETADSHPFDIVNSWDCYDKIASRIEKSFQAWQSGKDISKPWWKLWA